LVGAPDADGRPGRDPRGDPLTAGRRVLGEHDRDELGIDHRLVDGEVLGHEHHR
jgi:hypothetical protein